MSSKLLMVGLAGWVLGASACGGAASRVPPLSPVGEEPTAWPETPAPVSTPESGVPRGAPDISRDRLLAVIDAGFGRFLQGIETEPVLRDTPRGAAFVGFRIVSFSPRWLSEKARQRRLLRPDDVVLEVNGRPIERPDQAFDVFEALRSAEALVLQLERDGENVTVSIPILPAEAR